MGDMASVGFAFAALRMGKAPEMWEKIMRTMQMTRIVPRLRACEIEKPEMLKKTVEK